jgi:hypothetical protein
MPAFPATQASLGRRATPRRGAAVLLALGFLAGCGRGERTYEVTEVRDLADAGPPAPEASVSARFGGDPHGGAPPDAAGPAKPEWSYVTPEGWELLPPARMRDLGWRVAGNPLAECTFSALPGGAGGLVANVNRWRRQMSLEPLDEAGFASLPKKTLLGRAALFLDMVGAYRGMGTEVLVPEARLLGLVVELPAVTAFLKLTGPLGVVEAETARFFALADSLKPKPGGVQPEAAAAPSASGGAPPPFAWTAPAGWVKQGDRSMRVVTFVPEKAPGAEVYVTVLGGAAGGARANVDRWRDQMGLPALTDDEFARLPRATVLGAEAVFAELEGSFAGDMGKRGDGRWMLLGMVLPRGDHSVFVKMTGPAAEVRGERDRFRAFCESLR